MDNPQIAPVLLALRLCHNFSIAFPENREQLPLEAGGIRRRADLGMPAEYVGLSMVWAITTIYSTTKVRSSHTKSSELPLS